MKKQNTVTLEVCKGHKITIDEEDLSRVLLHKWHPQLSLNKKYYYYFANVSRDYAAEHGVNLKPSQSEKQRTRISIHRFIMGHQKTGYQIDHIDGDRTNNSKSNLRWVNQSQNSSNMRKTDRPVTSKFKGVSFHKLANKYITQLMKNRKLYYGGLFADEADAARAYDEMAKQHYGEYACTNQSMGLL